MINNKKRFMNILNATIITAALLCGVVFIACSIINKNAEKAIHNSIKAATVQFKDDINKTVNGDIEQLEEIADIINQYEDTDGENARNIIMGFKGFSTISRLEMLLPDNTMIISDGNTVEAPGNIRFSDEAEKGLYISELTKDSNFGDSAVIKKAVPIIRDGETRAILYGVVDIANFEDVYKSEIYKGSATLYIVESGSGNLLMGASEDTAENIYDMEVSEDYIRLKENIKNMESGYTLLHTQKFKDNLYLYYTPVGINDWVAIISIPEGAAFEDANKFETVLYILSFVLLLILGFYFAYLIKTINNELKYVKFMLRVSQSLFDSHKNKNKFKTALKIVERKTDAGSAFFIGIENRKMRNFFYSSYDPLLSDYLKNIDENDIFLDELYRSGSIIYRRQKEFTLGNGEKIYFKNLMLSAVKDGEGDVVGVLGVINMRQALRSTAVLEDIKLLFSMACNSFNSYKIIHRLGTVDSLTGIKNRNLYEKAIEEFEAAGAENFSCVYVDANGLHSMNNSLGHKAGDKMLKCVADCMKKEFGSCCYRIGGDEFVVLVKGLSHKEALAKADNMCKNVEKSGYKISLGVEFAERLENINDVINNAERKMQENKYLYYQQSYSEGDAADNKTSSKRKIRQTAFSDHDANVFLSVIAPRFMGGYLVNLDKDNAHIVYIPEHFERTLKKTGGKFSDAIRMYVHERVQSDYAREFEMCFDFNWIIAQLNKNIVPTLKYKRKDDKFVVLKIYKSTDYSENNHETVWVFEKCD